MPARKQDSKSLGETQSASRKLVEIGEEKVVTMTISVCACVYITIVPRAFNFVSSF